MRYVEVHRQAPSRAFDEEAVSSLAGWLALEVEDALSSRYMMENVWIDCLRMYEGVPKNPNRNFPVENAPNLEVTIGAIACDALFAQTVDTVFTLSPFVSVQPVPKKKDDQDTVENAKAMQRFVNWIAGNETDAREAGEEAILDTIQLGTGVYYIPWVERRKKALAFSVKAAHPIIKCMPPEDVVFPAGGYRDPQTMPWVGLRFHYTSTELQEEAKRSNWDIGADGENVAKVGKKSNMREQRERLARSATGPAHKGDIYEIYKIWAFYDIDGDGIDEDLMIVWDRGSKNVLRVDFNPYDWRPLEFGNYQKRPHIPWGLGVLEMLGPYEAGISEFYNYWSLNSLIANTKNFISRSCTLPENMVIWPGKNTEVDGDPGDVQVFDLGRSDASLPQAMATTVSLAERRVGLNEMNITRPSQVLGSRTPGITAHSMLQQINRRFTPAFDSMRLELAAAIRQCLYRYQERLLAGNTQVMDHIAQVLGIEDGMRVIQVLKDQTFDEALSLELTAVSATVNKETERQSSIMLIQTLAKYYQQTLKLVMVADNIQIPNEVRSVASKIAKASGELIERTIRTFDSIRDPDQFVIDIQNELDSMVDRKSTRLN